MLANRNYVLTEYVLNENDCMDNHRTEAPEESTCAKVMAMRNVSGGNHRVRDYSRDRMGQSCRFCGCSQRQRGCPALE